MQQSTNPTLTLPTANLTDPLTEILRDGARRLLAMAIEAEVEEWIAAHCELLVRVPPEYAFHQVTVRRTAS